MRVFVLYDPSDRAYPMMGIYSTLEKAFAAGQGRDGSGEQPTPGLCVYEEELDQVYDDLKNPPFEPVYHELPRKP